MNHLAEVPLWIALPVAVLVVAGSSLALIGTIGLAQLQTFYDRLHAPTIGTSWGIASMLLGSMLLFSWLDTRLVLHELVLGILVIGTTPATYVLLGRAALHRDRAEKSPYLPSAAEGPDDRPGDASDEGMTEVSWPG